MEAERMRVLEMLQQGHITAEQANALLSALEQSQEKAAEPDAARPRPLATVDLAQIGPRIAEAITRHVQAAFSPALPHGPAGRERANYSSMKWTAERLSRMGEGTRFTNYGHLTIGEDVPEELLSRTIAAFANYGRVIGPENLIGLLEDRCDENYGVFLTPAEAAAEKRQAGAQDEKSADMTNLGKTTLTPEQLMEMADGVTYANLGKLTVSPDVPEELLRRKIAVYRNLGKTSGPANLLGILQARCPENLGKFSVWREGGPAPCGEEDQDDDHED